MWMFMGADAVELCEAEWRSAQEPVPSGKEAPNVPTYSMGGSSAGVSTPMSLNPPTPPDAILQQAPVVPKESELGKQIQEACQKSGLELPAEIKQLLGLQSKPLATKLHGQASAVAKGEKKLDRLQKALDRTEQEWIDFIVQLNDYLKCKRSEYEETVGSLKAQIATTTQQVALAQQTMKQMLAEENEPRPFSEKKSNNGVVYQQLAENLSKALPKNMATRKGNANSVPKLPLTNFCALAGHEDEEDECTLMEAESQNVRKLGDLSSVASREDLEKDLSAPEPDTDEPQMVSVKQAPAANSEEQSGDADFVKQKNRRQRQKEQQKKPKVFHEKGTEKKNE
ncbi:unnamed protein product [Effrenium voratum]|nr:unnamed protein product [Effrenium voratum]